MFVTTSYSETLVLMLTPSQFILNFQYHLRIALFACMKRPGSITFTTVLEHS